MSRWALAGTLAQAFGGRPSVEGIPRSALQPVFWLQLLLGEHRAEPDGDAVCMLDVPGPARTAKRLGAATVLAALCVTLVVFARYTWPAVVFLAAASLLVLPAARRSVAGIPARRRLRGCLPPGRTVTVHSVASITPGAGRQLLGRVNDEADRRRWTLVLTAANDTLAGYYQGLGYEIPPGAASLPSGVETAGVPMVRRPVQPQGAATAAAPWDSEGAAAKLSSPGEVPPS